MCLLELKHLVRSSNILHGWLRPVGSIHLKLLMVNEPFWCIWDRRSVRKLSRFQQSDLTCHPKVKGNMPGCLGTKTPPDLIVDWKMLERSKVSFYVTKKKHRRLLGGVNKPKAFWVKVLWSDETKWNYLTSTTRTSRGVKLRFLTLHSANC